MKICILCIGSHGDIRPYVALGIGLKNRGYDVTIASHPQAESHCKNWNLNFARVDGDLATLMPEQNTADLVHKSSNKVATFLNIIRAFKSVLSVQLSDSLAAVTGADVLIYSPAAFAGPHLAEYLNIPSFQMILQPDAKTAQHPSCLFSSQPRLGGVGYLMGYFLAAQLLWQPVRKQINRWRKDKLQLRKMHFLGPAHDASSKTTPCLIAFSPTLVPRPDDWAAHVYMTNFCRIAEGTTWEPPQKLLDFLAAGEPPIYVGFGSLTPATPKAAVEKIISVLQRTKQRAIVMANLPGIEQLAISPNIFLLDYAPHDWLISRMRAVIHHGGVGTTAAGLYAGKPALVMPFMLDQFCWGKKIASLGVGPDCLPIKKLDEQLLEARLGDLFNPRYQLGANQLMAKLLAEEDGVEATIRVVLKALV